MKEIKKYTIKNAIKEIKKGSKSKFDETLEVHINLDLDPKKQDQSVRYTTMLPHGTGKTLKVAVFASKKVNGADLELVEGDLKKIEKGDIKPGVDFDVLVAEPRTMPKLAQIARVLGPAGVMPNPKNGTVTEDVEKAVEQFKKGKIEIRLEPNAPIIHTGIGKVSFSEDKLEENLNEVLTTLRQHKPQKAKPEFIKSVFLCSTMGKSHCVELE